MSWHGDEWSRDAAAVELRTYLLWHVFVECFRNPHTFGCIINLMGHGWLTIMVVKCHSPPTCFKSLSMYLYQVGYRAINNTWAYIANENPSIMPHSEYEHEFFANGISTAHQIDMSRFFDYQL